MVTLVILVSLYIASQIFSDIGSLKILLFFGLSIDGGTLIYPITFTLRDVLHKYTDKQTVRAVILTAGVINIFMAFFFLLLSYLPADLSVGSQESFGQLLAPVFRITFASIIAEIVSEFIDTEVYERVGRVLWKRVLYSNAVAIPVDSFIFSAVAFLGDLPFEVVVSIFVSNILLKFFISSLVLPLIYLGKRHV